MAGRLGNITPIVVGVWALGIGGCVVDLSTEEATFVTCGSDTDCPDNMLCRGNPGRCLAPEIAAAPAPQLAAPPSISPPVGGLGASFLIALDVVGELGETPSLTLDSGARSVAVPAASSGTDAAAGHYVFVYAVDGSELSGARPLSLQLVGKNGAITSGLAAGSLLIDFTPPQLAGAPNVSPNLVGSGGSVTLTFELSEEPAAMPTVSLRPFAGGDDYGATVTVGGGPRTYVATYMPVGDEEEGTLEIFIDAADAAGNVANDLYAGIVTFDLTPPAALNVEVRYIPDADNPLFEVSAVRPGGEARLSFETAEPLGETPAVTLSCDGTSTSLSRQSGQVSTTYFTFVYGPSTVDVDSACSLAVDLTDLADNSAVSDLGATLIRVDSLAPPALSESELAGLLHLRLPWGGNRGGARFEGQWVASSNLGAEAAPDAQAIDSETFDVSLGVDGVADNIVEARVYADAAGQQLIGVVRRMGDGYEPALLSSFDDDRVFVSRLDHAGNRSPPVAVRFAEVTATLDGRIPGSASGNPHRFLRSLSPPRAGLPGGVEADGGGVGTAAGGSLRDTSTLNFQAVRTTLGDQSGNPLVAAYDSGRGQGVVLDGGSAAGDRVRVFDGYFAEVVITDPEGDGSPDILANMSFAFDERRGVGVLLDLATIDTCSPQPCTRVWEWNGASWRRRDFAGGPTQASRGVFVWDASAQALLHFGGVVDAVSSAETWTYDGTGWVERCTGSCTRPSARYGSRAAYERATQRIVLFGGTPGSNETWQWFGDHWEQATPTTTPPGRSDGVMAFDHQRQRVFMFGGTNTDCPSNVCRLGWEWTGTNWLRRPLINPQRHVFPNVGSVAFYDEARAQVVKVDNSDVYLWNGVTWTRVRPQTPGSSTIDCVTADPRRGVWQLLLDNMALWEHDGTRWMEACGSECAEPPNRYASTLVFDEHRGVTVLFGGLDGVGGGPLNDVWEWDGALWTDVTPGSPGADGAPTPRNRAAATYDPILRKIVLYGGGGDEDLDISFGDIWTWNGTLWDRLDPVVLADGTPDSRGDAYLYYDTGSEELRMTGGRSGTNGDCDGGSAYSCHDLWSFDRTSWRRLGRIDVGGTTSDFSPIARPELRDDLLWFRYDGEMHIERVDADGPRLPIVPDPSWALHAPSVVGAAFISPHTGAGLVAGGFVTGGLWTLDVPFSRPAHTLVVDIDAAGPGLADAALTDLRIRWDGAATSQATTGVSRVALRAFQSSFGVNLNTTYGSTTQPIDSLTPLGLRDPAAVWTLWVHDCCSGNVGTLNSWCVIDVDGATSCNGGSHALTDAQTTSDAIDLRGLPSTPLGEVRISVNITHPAIDQVSLLLEVGRSAGAMVDGIDLYARQQSEWILIGSNDADPETSVDGTWRIDYPGFAPVTIPDRLPTMEPISNHRFITIYAAPKGTNGADFATLTTDYAEVSLRYLLAP